jgi:TPR repeat protein
MSRKITIATALVLSSIAFLSSLRTLAVEATLPYSLVLDNLRPFRADVPANVGSRLASWTGDKILLQQHYMACRAIAQNKRNCLPALSAALKTSPTNGRMWLEMALVLTQRGDVTEEAVHALEMSYLTASREGWIAAVRLKFVIDKWNLLPAQVRLLAARNILEPWEYALNKVPHALDLLKMAAEAGHPYALKTLGQIYLNGDGIPADSQKARNYLERAIKAGSPGAGIRLGEALVRGNLLPKDSDRGIELLESVAITGSWDALETLGKIYLYGDGVPADPQKGRDYLERAIKAGSSGALVRLGEALVKGEQLPQDINKGVKLLEAAAAYGSWGKVTLANLILAGYLPYNVGRALDLLDGAAEAGDPYALERLAQIYLNGEGVSADPQKARDYSARAKARK